MPRFLQISHGFPPDEAAGTEQYALRLARGLRARGWEVHTVAAHRAPGGGLYERRYGGDGGDSGTVCRVVQNAAGHSLRHGEHDAVMDGIIREEIRRFRPDHVHVQHLMFLSTTFLEGAAETAGAAGVPVSWTLHDAWTICGAGGLLLDGGAPCAGPGARCGACAGAWGRQSLAEAAAIRLAGVLAGWVPGIDAARLHRMYRRLPARVRAGIAGIGAGERGERGEEPGQVRAERGRDIAPERLAARRENIARLAARATLIAPSRYLADRLRAGGICGRDGAIHVVPHGVDAPDGGSSGERGFLLFLGTLAPHKGPHLVREAWARAGRPIPLRIVGPAGPDAQYVAALHAHAPAPEPPADPWPLLRQARALVLGSVWPENAPLVVLEARAAGCPVIAPDIGGIPEIVSAADGLLYPPGDVDALAAAIRIALARSWRPVAPQTFSAHLDAFLRRIGQATS